MTEPNEGSKTSDTAPERESSRPPLRLNLLRWDSEWLRQRLSRVQENLDRAVDELEKPSDP